MTNEKAIKWLKVEASYIEEDVGHGKEILEAYDTAIKALEQEPCNDAISRQAVFDICKKEIDHISKNWQNYHSPSEAKSGFSYIATNIYDMPSVTPQPKIGYWIEDAKTYYEELNKRGLGVDEYTPYFIDDIACSECLAKYSVIDNETEFFKFCPNCGAKTEVSE